MNLETLEKCMPHLLEAKITPWVWGYHGRGKSQFIENFCKSRDWLVFNFRLGTQADVGDLLGLSEIVEHNGHSFTKFHKPDWMQQAFDFCEKNPDKKAVVFLDEINRIVRQDLIPPVFQMALDGRLHTHIFPENLCIVAASNPDTKDYKVTKFRDKAFYDRFWHVEFNPTKEEWLNWTKKNSYPDEIIGFLMEQPEFIENTELEDFGVSDYVERGRRSWDGVKRLYTLGTPKDIIMSIAPGLIEAKTVAAWRDYLDKGGKPLTADDILMSYVKVKSTVQKYSKVDEENRQDIIKYTCDNLVEFIKEDNKPIVNKARENLVEFMLDIPGEVCFDFCQEAGHFTHFIDVVNSSNSLMDMLEEAKGTKVVNG